MYFKPMTNPWFLQDVAVDYEALEWLAALSRRTATALDHIAEDRRRSTSTTLARCRGPLADHLRELLQARTAEELALARRCRHLADLVLEAATTAQAEQNRRVEFRTANRAGAILHPAHIGPEANGGEGW